MHAANPNASDHDIRGFSLVFMATLAVFIATLTMFVVANRHRLPAPRISASESFNEKALWLAHRLANGPDPDVLVVGSSMGVNNIHGSILRTELGAKGVVNASSWGLSMGETCTLLDELLPRINPRVVLIPVYHGDFDRGPTKDFQSHDLARLLSGGAEVSTYVRNLDLWYYARTLHSQAQRRPLGRATYDSLEFDETGGVPLACENFLRSDMRWNGFLRDKPVPADFSPAALESLARLGRVARGRQIAFCVVVSPLRLEAEKVIAPEVRANLWRSVRATVEGAGGIFIGPGTEDFSDADFVDYNHLNRCGAEKFTRASAKNLLQRMTRL